MMTQTPPDGERFEFTTDLRRGGWVGITSSSLVVATDEQYRVAADDIQEVTFEDVDWFVGILGLVIVGYGLYSIQFDALFGLGFAAIGVGSLYLTYRKRNRVRIRVVGRPKPLTVYPESMEPLRQALEPVLAQRDDSST
jgi:hypothetical protein